MILRESIRSVLSVSGCPVNNREGDHSLEISSASSLNRGPAIWFKNNIRGCLLLSILLFAKVFRFIVSHHQPKTLNPIIWAATPFQSGANFPLPKFVPRLFIFNPYLEISLEPRYFLYNSIYPCRYLFLYR